LLFKQWNFLVSIMQQGTTSTTSMTAMPIDLCDSDSATDSESSASDLPTSDESGYESDNDRNGDSTSNLKQKKNQRFIASSDDEEESDEDEDRNNDPVAPESSDSNSHSKPSNKSVSVTKLTCLAPITNKQQHLAVIDDAEIRDQFSTKLYKLTRKTMENLYGHKIKSLTAQHVKPRYPQQLSRQHNSNLSCGYAQVAGWGAEDGFREMIQNWFDGCQSVANRLYAFPKHVIQPVTHRNNLAYYFFAYKEDDEFDIRHVANNELLGCMLLKKEKGCMVLKLVNYGIALDSSVVIMGQTSKSHGRSVGKFGEGLKMGACILLQWGHKFSILTNKKNWKFSFKKSKHFDNAAPTLYVSPHQKEGNAPAQVVVTISNVGIEPVTLENLVQQVNVCRNIERRRFFPLYHPKAEEHIRIQDAAHDLDGHILFGDYYRNAIYSNGFYVGYDERCFFGYNINRTLPLTRDRCLTGKGLRRLHEEIPKYWRHAIQDADSAAQYLKMAGDGKPTHQYMELHPDHLGDLLNDQTATLLFDNFLAHTIKQKEEDEEKLDAEQTCTKYFIVPTEVSKEDEDRILNELRRKPYKIDKELYAIFEQSHKFQTLTVALQRELDALSNASIATLSDAEKEFVAWFAQEMKSLFPVLSADAYVIQFKETDMKFLCKIIDKNIIFKAKKLHLTDTNDAQQSRAYFVQLLRGLKDQLVLKDIVSKDEADESLIGGYFEQSQFKNQSKSELAEAQQRAVEMQQRNTADGALIEHQANEIEQLQKRLKEFEKEDAESEVKVDPVEPQQQQQHENEHILDNADGVNDANNGNGNNTNSVFFDHGDDDQGGDYDPGYGGGYAWNVGVDDDEGNWNGNQLLQDNDDINIDRKRRFDELDLLDDHVSTQSATKRQRLNDVSLPTNHNMDGGNAQSVPAAAAVNETVDHLQTINNEMSEKLKRKNLEVVACTGEISELKNIIAEMEAEMTDLQETLREMRLSCNSKDALIAQQQKELEQLKQKISKIASVFQE